MRAFREQDFDQMAERVVDRFMSGAKLADAATDEAMGGELNPDQIARLVQAANTMAFLRLMEQQKQQGGHDMTNEFDPIDPRQVMQKLVGSVDVPHMDGAGPDMGQGMPSETPPGMPPGMQHAAPGGDAGPLPNEMGQHDLGGDEPPTPADLDGDDDGADDNDGPFPKGDKQKAKDKSEKKDTSKKKGPPEKDKTKEAAYRSRRMHKLADVLEDQYKQAEWAFEDAFANLQQHLKRAHGAPSPEAFEKDALALHGDQVGVVVLNMVKQAQGLPVLEFEAAATKTAALADRHLVDDTEPNRIFATMVKIAAEAMRLKSGAAYARAQCS
jgi:hypothetical protein